MPPLPTGIMPRLHVDMKLLVPAVVVNGGKRHKAVAMYDTGAEPTAVLSPAFARKIGFRPTGNVMMIGVNSPPKASATGWIDGLEIPGANCRVGREKVAVADLPGSDYDMLIGLAFHEDAGVTVRGKSVVCDGGVPTSYSPVIKKVAIGAVLALGVLLIGYVTLSD